MNRHKIKDLIKLAKTLEIIDKDYWELNNTIIRIKAYKGDNIVVYDTEGLLIPSNCINKDLFIDCLQKQKDRLEIDINKLEEQLKTF